MPLLKNGFLEKIETWHVVLSCQYTHFTSFSSKSEHDTVADQATLRILNLEVYHSKHYSKFCPHHEKHEFQPWDFSSVTSRTPSDEKCKVLRNSFKKSIHQSHMFRIVLVHTKFALGIHIWLRKLLSRAPRFLGVQIGKLFQKKKK